MKNTYRYRGYRYDNETGYYYLQSRDYNPEMGRFINADAIAGSIGELLSHNIFAYCGNDVINRHDPSGFIWDFLDFGFAALSWGDFAKKPSMGTFALATFDTVACLPGIPSSGYFTRGAKVADKVGDAIKGAGNSIDELLETVSYSNKHSKGARWVPENLTDKLAMEEVLTNPSAGKQLNMRKGMTDPRWHQDDGWVKMSKNVNGIEIHYVWNKVLNVFDDFKFK
ncbi:MAG: RHS repeat-associated core domain-containing protein [Clostridium sp.]|uniref:RHS repeat-associated core domain-containing protein n=1 Tax=Clostridium sp. TaxID=1506 RepID=UPI003026096E